MWVFPLNLSSFKQREVLRLSFYGRLTVEGKGAWRVLEGGIRYYGLRMSGKERSGEMVGANMILESLWFCGMADRASIFRDCEEGDAESTLDHTGAAGSRGSGSAITPAWRRLTTAPG